MDACLPASSVGSGELQKRVQQQHRGSILFVGLTIETLIYISGEEIGANGKASA